MIERTFIGKVSSWCIIFEEPGLIAATTEGKLDIDGVERGAPALQIRESMHEGTYLWKVIFGHELNILEHHCE